MAFRTETITVLPAVILFTLASYLAFLTTQFSDVSMKKALITVALCLFVGGLVMAVCWGYYWAIRKAFQRKEK
jgi:membrane protease YdiL (CAAX protease family)